MLRRANIWYSLKDGRWSDPSVWLSNGTKKHALPQPGDTVYINHTLTADITTAIKNLYIAGTLNFAAGH